MRKVLKSINFLSFYPIWSKFTSKSMLCKDLSSQLDSLCQHCLSRLTNKSYDEKNLCKRATFEIDFK